MTMMTAQPETLNPVAVLELVITRTFDAPRQEVFQAFTEADRLARWWGPQRLSMRVARLDLRPGGLCHYCLQTPDGNQVWGRFQYHTLVAPERLVFVNAFSDANGNVTRAPFNATWPLEIRNTLTLTEADGQTVLTLRSGPCQATDAERHAFESGIPALRQASRAPSTTWPLTWRKARRRVLYTFNRPLST
jgi:uncharacterized protein YndB with AHSA1/START domain